MLKKFLIPAISVAGITVSGCSTQPTTYPSFSPAPVAQRSATTAFHQKTGTLFVLLDASSSTSATYDGNTSGKTKFDVEKQFLNQLNKTIPSNAHLSTGLQSFGWGSANLIQAIAPHSTSTFQTSLDQAHYTGGGTPLGSALEATAATLESARGNINLLIVSDGKVSSDAFTQAAALKSSLGDRLCISSAWVGNSYDKEGQFVLQELSNIAGCGKNINAADLNTPSAMAHFVEDSLYSKIALTAAPIMVRAKPELITEKDTDGDGISNTYDKCKNTPEGAIVNAQGCWSYSKIGFAFNGSTIQPSYTALFDNATYVLKRNPDITIQLEGHTDSKGSEKYNMALSKRRAQEVKKRLVIRGINANRISTIGKGETQPIADNKNEKGRAENRRVGFTITGR